MNLNLYLNIIFKSLFIGVLALSIALCFAESSSELEAKRAKLQVYIKSLQSADQPTTPNGKNALALLNNYYSGQPTDIQEVISLFEKAHQSNDTAASVYLGQIYATGLGGIAKDEGKALTFLEQGVQNESASADYHLGLLLIQSVSDIRDEARGKQYLKQAYKKGYPLAAATLGKLAAQGGDYKTARMWLTQGEQQGDLDAMTSLGQLYLQGLGVKRDAKQGLALIERAWDSGWHDAGVAFYDAYVFGQGINKNLNKGLQYLNETAQLGSPYANALYCNHLFHGTFGITKNIPKGIQLCEKAIELGSIHAPHFLANYYAVLQDDPMHYPKARELYWLAAKRGNPMAMAKIGVNTMKQYKGAIFDVNPNLALEQFKQSADLGWPESMAFAALLFAASKHYGVTELSEPDLKQCWLYASLALEITQSELPRTTLNYCQKRVSEVFKESQKEKLQKLLTNYKKNYWTQHYLNLIATGRPNILSGE